MFFLKRNLLRRNKLMFIDVHSNMGKPIECNANIMLRQTGDTRFIRKCLCKRTHKEQVRPIIYLGSIWGKNGFDIFKHFRNWFCSINLLK